MTNGFQLREVFNARLVGKLAQSIKKSWPEFDQKRFEESINARLTKLSFGDRCALIADQLGACLPHDFPKASDILIRSLGPELVRSELTGFDGFYVMPQCLFISRNGLDYFDISMKALYEMTKRFSAEGDIRPFITRYPDKTLKLLAQWSKDTNCHVRRLVSEGTRPRLPLGARLPAFQRDPIPVISLLEKLKTDPVLYVRRSVANNLNDISKDNPEVVVETLRRWSSINNRGTQWIIRHALRTLIKNGNQAVLSLLGYRPNPLIEVGEVKLSAEIIEIGGTLHFDIIIKSLDDKPLDLMIDYAVHYKKANGTLVPKVFKLAQKKIAPGGTLTLSKKHSLKPMTTRRHYPGEHLLVLLINGKEFGKRTFYLTE